jgi:predicted transposase YbfD/YdcC
MVSMIPDPRRAQGRRHPLPILLTLAILGLCSGQVSYKAIEEWIENYQEDLEQLVPFLSGHLINASTFQRVFARLESQELEEILGKWLQQVIPFLPNEPIAIDGKTLSGLDCHLLAAFAHYIKGVLFEIGTDTKGKELVIAPKLLEQIPVAGHMITADALHTQKVFCQQITQKQGGYCFTVKGNQQKLEEDIKLFFHDLPFKAQVETGSKHTRAKGKLTTYTITVSQDLNDYLTWPGLTHIWQLTREVTHIKTGKVTLEIVVGIARLLKEEKAAEQIIDLVQGHWSIENRLHRQRDVIFLEDRSTIRTNNAPQVMAALKNLVISIYHRAGVRYFPTAFRRFLAVPDELFALLGLTNVAI